MISCMTSNVGIGGILFVGPRIVSLAVLVVSTVVVSSFVIVDGAVYSCQQYDHGVTGAAS